MEFFERWCPDYFVYNSSEGDEEEIETKTNNGGTKISIRDFFSGAVNEGNSSFGCAADLNALFQNLPAVKKRNNLVVDINEAG